MKKVKREFLIKRIREEEEEHIDWFKLLVLSQNEGTVEITMDEERAFVFVSVSEAIGITLFLNSTNGNLPGTRWKVFERKGGRNNEAGIDDL